MNQATSTRLETFSDAVFAIIMTLLILEIRVPEIKGTSLNDVIAALKPILPKFISFTISFFTIAIFWVNHHHFYNYIKFVDWKLMWLNIVFLFWICVLPFTTAFIGDYSNVPAVVAIYSLNMFFCGSSFSFMAYYAVQKAGMSIEALPEVIKKKEIRKGIMGACLYAATIGIAFVFRPLALFIFLAVPVLYVVPGLFMTDKNEEI